jgi:transposase
MESGMKRTQRDYSLAFKLGVVDQVEKGALSYKEAQRRYGIQGRSTVLVWLRKHGRQDWSVRRSPVRKGVGMKVRAICRLPPSNASRSWKCSLSGPTRKRNCSKRCWT